MSFLLNYFDDPNKIIFKSITKSDSQVCWKQIFQNLATNFVGKNTNLTFLINFFTEFDLSDDVDKVLINI